MISKGTTIQRSNRVLFAISFVAFILLAVASAYLAGRKTEANYMAQRLSAQREFLAKATPAPGTYTDYASRTAALEVVDEAYRALRKPDITQAKQLLQKVLRTDPTLRGAHLLLAEIALAESDLSAATMHATTALQEGVGSSRPNLLRGRIFLMENNPSGALNAFEEAAREDPFDMQPFFLWGENLREQGKPREAIRRLEQALLRAGSSTDAFAIQCKYHLARVEGGDGALLGADIIRQLTARPEAGEWLLAAAALAIHENKLDKAADHLRKAKNSLPPALYNFVVQDRFYDLYRDQATFAGLLK